MIYTLVKHQKGRLKNLKYILAVLTFDLIITKQDQKWSIDAISFSGWQGSNVLKGSFKRF